MTATPVVSDTTDVPSICREPWEQQLALPRRSMRIRKECLKNVITDSDKEHHVFDGRTITWSDTLDIFKQWLRDKRDYANAEWCDFDHRFTRNWTSDKYAELCGVDRYCQENFDDLHTVWMTLNGDKWNDNGGFRCGLDYLNELLMSNVKVGRKINKYLDNRFARFTVLGAHKHGFPHVHWGFYVERRPDREPFMRALHAHFQDSPIALECQHPPDDAISIEPADPDPQFDHSDNDVPVTRLVHEASSQLLWPETDSGIDVLDAAPHKQRFATLLWAAHYTRQWRTGDTFDEICDGVQEAYAEAQEDVTDDLDDESEDSDIEWDEFDDPVNPTVEIEPYQWSKDIDPLDTD